MERKDMRLRRQQKKLAESLENAEWQASVTSELHANQILGAKELFAESLSDFANLHAANGEYKGPLEGMRIVKKEIAKDNIEYFYPGDIIEDLDGLEGVKFYVLGPPEKWSDVETESGGEDESYTHNTKLKGTDAFAASILNTINAGVSDNIFPFESIYEIPSTTVSSAEVAIANANPFATPFGPVKQVVEQASGMAPAKQIVNPVTTPPQVNQVVSSEDVAEAAEIKAATKTIEMYKGEESNWRNIDNDWLFSAGNLALRINSLTNNLSLALAIEFDDSKRVMLFPGDAEYGSWASWHKINWKGVTVPEGKHFTQDLLKRTVFYKIAHHMSHNGTAQRLGLEMMDDKDFAAMGTLDYNVISKNWKNTMPNREMLQELLKRTKGRLMIMNDSNLFYDFNEAEPLPNKIKEAQKKLTSKEKNEFESAYKREPNNLFVEYTVQA